MPSNMRVLLKCNLWGMMDSFACSNAIAITIGFAEFFLDFTLLRWFHCSKLKIHGDTGELA